MKLQFIFDQLTYGELQHIKLGGHREETGITVADYPAIVSHLNLALTALHTEFPLRRETVFIQQDDNISTYVMSSTYAVSNLNSIANYILDTVDDPFLDNLTYIESVVDELGVPFALNIENCATSLQTPIYNALYVPTPDSSIAMKVSYRANHVMLNATAINVDTEIYIPMSLLNVLLLFIKQRIYASLPTLEGVQTAQVAMQMYMVELENMKNQGVTQSETSINTIKESAGWV